MRILVCGGRDYASTATINAELDALHAERGITCLIHGAARGAAPGHGDWSARETHSQPFTQRTGITL